MDDECDDKIVEEINNQNDIIIKNTTTTTTIDEKVPDSSDTNQQQSQQLQQQKNKNVKPKKRKKPKDSTAPRHPLTGYVRYLNDRRETVRTENPTLSFAEITKMLASEWTNLPIDKKQQYLDAAEQDRERYTKEYNAYKQTEAYKLFTQQQQYEKKMKDGKDQVGNTTTTTITTIANHSNTMLPTVTVIPTTTTATLAPPLPSITIKDHHHHNNDLDFSNFDIPIFTEEFLDHNKTRDVELRQLRKANIDYEQQNAILQKHIDNMKDAINKMEIEIEQREKNNESLEKHLIHLRTTLSNGFGGIELPGVKDTANLNNIDSYMTNLHSILLENSNHDVNLLQTVRNIVGRLEFNG